jgi:hypothetical protein
MAHAVAFTVRVGGAAVIAYAVPMAWSHLPHPGWSTMLAVWLLAENAAVAWWIWRGGFTPMLVALDVSTGMLALPIGLWLAGDVQRWTAFVYPYTVLLAFTLGLFNQRRTSTLMCALAWAASAAASMVLFGHVSLPSAILATPGYLVNAMVGALCARRLRSDAEQLDAARTAVLAQAVSTAATAEHARHARALHDRVLQTMESLARGETVRVEPLRARVAEQAAWLRRFVETGRVDAHDDLPTALAAVARVVARGGVDVQLNDASLRHAAAAGDATIAAIGEPQREAIVDVAHQAMALVAAVTRSLVARVAPQAGGVLITVLANGPATAPDPDQTAHLTSQVSAAGGHLSIEPIPYITVWLPVTPRRP